MHRKFLIAALALATVSHLARADDSADAKAAAVAVVNALAKGDRDALAKNFVGTGADKQLADAMIDLLQAADGLHAASVKQFGNDQAKESFIDPARMTQQVQDSTVNITGDSAELVAKDVHSPHEGMQLKRVDGQWKVSQITGNAEVQQKLLGFLPGAAKIMSETTDEISNGKYANPAEVRVAMQGKIMTLIQQSGVATAAHKSATEPTK